MPASFRDVAGTCKGRSDLDWRDGTGGFFFEDEPGEEETFGEEVDS